MFCYAPYESGQHHFGKDLASNRQEGYSPTIAAGRLFTLPFVYGNNICVSPLLGDSSMIPYIGNEVENCSGAEIASLFKDLCRDAIRARGLVVFK